MTEKTATTAKKTEKTKRPAEERTGALAVVMLALESIYIRPAFNTRREGLGVDDLRGLAEELRANGQLQPIGVAPLDRSKADHAGAPKAAGYVLVFGERRFRAAHLLGWKTIAATIVADTRAANIAENFQRKDLRHWERVEYIVAAKREGVSHKDLARQLDVSEQVITTDLGIGTKLARDIYDAWKKYPNASKIALQIYSKPEAEQRELWEAWLKGGQDDVGARIRAGSKAADEQRDKKSTGRASVKELTVLLAEVERAQKLAAPGTPIARELDGMAWGVRYAMGMAPVRAEDVKEHMDRVEATFKAEAKTNAKKTAKAEAEAEDKRKAAEAAEAEAEAREKAEAQREAVAAKGAEAGKAEAQRRPAPAVR